MDDGVILFLVCFVAGLCLWFGWITYRIEQIGGEASEVHGRFDSIEDALAQSLGFLIEKVKQIEDIKDFVPNIIQNQSPLQPLLDHILRSVASDGSNAPSDFGRDESGQFTAKEMITDGEKEG